MAFLQALPLYLTFWYKLNELATHGTVVFSTSAVAIAFSGMVSFGVTKNLNSTHGLADWRGIFVSGGMLVIVIRLMW